MGFCTKLTKAGVAVGIVPVAIIISALLEEPVVQHLDGDGGHIGSRSHVGLTAAGATPTAGAVDAAPGMGDNADGRSAISGEPELGGMGSGAMFDRIAFAYDAGNRLMSLGLDQFWRKVLVEQCLRPDAGSHVLDLATGTADVSLLVAQHMRQQASMQSGGSLGSVMGLDPSVEMLRRGVQKAEDQGFSELVTLVKGDAQDLSSYRGVDSKGSLGEVTAGLADNSIDRISMSFGIRNVPNRTLAFREMRRVLRPSAGRVCIMEFSLPDGRKALSKVARFFITRVVPLIGQLVTLNSGGEEYQYLERSIMRFPQPLDFAAEMGREGLRVGTVTSFAYGAVHLYCAKPTPADGVAAGATAAS